MDFESNMNNDYFNEVSDSPQKYFITYKRKINGASSIVSGEAISRCNAEELFNAKFHNCEIVKIQTRDEWIDDIGEELAKGLIKHIKTLEGIIDPSKINEIDYGSKSFLKGLRKVNEQIEKDVKMSTPDSDKMRSSYNI